MTNWVSAAPPRLKRLAPLALPLLAPLAVWNVLCLSTTAPVRLTAPTQPRMRSDHPLYPSASRLAN